MTAIKICGLTTVEAVEHCADLGVEAIGLVLARSPRQLEPRDALRLFRAVPEGIFRVAVFRDPDPVLLAAVCRFPIDAVQTEASWRGELPSDVRWLPAFRDGPGLVEQVGEATLADADARWPASFFVDGPDPGSGRQGDYSRAAAAALLGPAALAGGLSADNVAAAISAVRPAAVDVSSGVESRRGVKDTGRITAFVQAVRGQG